MESSQTGHEVFGSDATLIAEDARARPDSPGWTVEMRIPVSQLRYLKSRDPQTWGLLLCR